MVKRNIVKALIVLTLSSVFVLFQNFSTSDEMIFYVSPTGNDADSGRINSPWKSLRKAATTLTSGQTAVFLNGTYVEDKPVYFTSSGTSDKRIIFRAQNPRQATIMFSRAIANHQYKMVVNRSFITIKDFVITQEIKHPFVLGADGRIRKDANGVPITNTQDILLASRPMLSGDPEWIYGTQFIGNRLSKAYEECLKGYRTSGLLMKGNSCQDTEHEGIDLVSVVSADIDSNEIMSVGRIGIIAKGGCKDIKIRNNYIHTLGRSMRLGGIYLGGVTGYRSMHLPADNGQPYEIYGSAAWNNVVFAQLQSGEGKIPFGLVLMGATDSGFFNNTVVNAETGLLAGAGGARDWGSLPRPGIMSGQFLNNIVYNAKVSAVQFPKSFAPQITQFNLFYAAVNSPNSSFSVVGNPNFDTTTTPYFRLRQGSAAIGVGRKTVFRGFFGEEYPLALDKIGRTRGVTPDMGAFQNSN